MSPTRSPSVVFGLGNPGRQYAETRHNVGFLVLDELARRLGASGRRRDHGAEIAEARLDDRRLMLVWPQTYMNHSGRAVSSVLRFYKLAPSDALVIYDDMDLAFGRVRLRRGGSSGGHNGVESIIGSLGTKDFPRLRVGIGRPPHGDAISYVLGRWRPEEREALGQVIADAAEAAEAALRHGIERAMNEFNSRARPGS